MKKLGILVVVAVLAAGCVSTGSSAGGGGGPAPYVVDLTKLTAMTMNGNSVGQPSGETVRNRVAFTRNYDNLVLLFPEFPVDVTKYQRVTIKCKYFGADGRTEITQGDGNAMVSIFYDPHGEIFADGNPNVALKEFNVGGFSGIVSSDRGSRIRLSKAPGGVLFQNSSLNVKFIECTAIIFHNGDYESN
jgi:hypothetical protein